jgi:enediyne biosynthesis thioesterase
MKTMEQTSLTPTLHIGSIAQVPLSNSTYPPVCESFTYEFETSLKHSNATQNVYFSNYFEWQGAVRERWFYECISRDMLQDKGVFITKQAHNNYIKEAFPFQTVRCVLNSYNIQRCSFYLLFRFYVEGELTSSGYQQIVFANHHKKIARLDDRILAKIKRYEIEL